MALPNPQSPGQRLRSGITTGSCAALAAKAAAYLLFSGSAPEQVSITAPNGASVSAPVLDPMLLNGTASCAVKKDAGDDPDITDGVLVHVALQKTAEPSIRIDGGEGIGRVTKKGLDQPVGAAAINSVPRAMIEAEIAAVCAERKYAGGIEALVSIPGGEQLAARTFNPRLGIEGGLSILGTSGIVMPMSSQALIDTIAVELRVVRAEKGDAVVLTPGNYGGTFIRANPALRRMHCVRISNFVGDAVDAAGAAGFRQVLLVGHMGKFIKLSGGIFNTHSHYADCRLELLALHAALAGADAALLRALLDAATVEEGWEIILSESLDQPVIRSILAAIDAQLARRIASRFEWGVIIYDNRHGLLGMTAAADTILKEWNEQ